MIDKDRKSQIMTDFQQHEGDTGSVDVQVAVLTERIRQLQITSGSITRMSTRESVF